MNHNKASQVFSSEASVDADLDDEDLMYILIMIVYLALEFTAVFQRLAMTPTSRMRTWITS